MNVPKQYKHWRMEKDRHEIAWLTFDKADSSANSLSKEVLEELELVLEDLKGWLVKGLVIRSGKKSGFIAGADVTEFTGLSDREEALRLIERGQGIMARLEQLPFPTLALINGFCLGGGLELALACRYRVALDSPDTRFGAPEVLLGINPGFGGTVRLTRLIGDIPALDLMLTGRTVDARKAKKLGIIDHAVPERQLENAARAVLTNPPDTHMAPFTKAFAGSAPLRPLVAKMLRGQVAKRARPDQYPAPYALIDLWQRSRGNWEAMYKEEARSVAALLTSPTSKNLVRVFFLRDRMRGLAKKSDFSLRRVHVIGGGTMGGDIAAWCALQGFVVTVQDVDHGRLANVVKRAADLFRKKLKSRREQEAAMDRLIPDRDGAAIGSADVVIEAIFEDLEAKKALFRSIEPKMRPDAILATNTSSIPLEELAQALSRPGRLVGLHFFNPVPKMELVEVVSSPGTDAEVQANGLAFVQKIKKLPLPVKSSPGFLVNRILMPYLLEAVKLVEEGTAPETVDKAAIDFGMPMGPILLADTVGLDICLSVAKILGHHFKTEVPKRLEELVAAGQLGKKSGSGFYRFEKGKAVQAGVTEKSSPDVADRLILRLVNEAAACLRQQVAADRDLIDAGVVFGTGFAPFRGGPIHFAEQEGITQVMKRLAELESRYGARFVADSGWVALREEPRPSGNRAEGE